jgi:hypothetical protein
LNSGRSSYKGLSTRIGPGMSIKDCVQDGLIHKPPAQWSMLRLARKIFLSIYFFQYAGISKTMTV